VDAADRDETDKLMREVLLELMRTQREILVALREIQASLLALNARAEPGPQADPMSSEEVPMLTETVQAAQLGRPRASDRF
jgi:hypothetical protein